MPNYFDYRTNFDDRGNSFTDFHKMYRGAYVRLDNGHWVKFYNSHGYVNYGKYANGKTIEFYESRVIEIEECWMDTFVKENYIDILKPFGWVALFLLFYMWCAFVLKRIQKWRDE